MLISSTGVCYLDATLSSTDTERQVQSLSLSLSLSLTHTLFVLYSASNKVLNDESSSDSESSLDDATPDQSQVTNFWSSDDNLSSELELGDNLRPITIKETNELLAKLISQVSKTQRRVAITSSTSSTSSGSSKKQSKSVVFLKLLKFGHKLAR